ncbi:hypothetical protein FUT87_26460 [Mitsuaria sp. TWR114]|uniref:hypothetical protein n=1 Tax=Mitsuaria sp. TWR114 TaxID=2601731 RepID=UPI0011BE573E|nr:hypothetical protein [Mitsuaria sp. TWR114]TXD68009.1 hypothetical protein FUT87_26460 [Mitsuaria sp. TWR114]
MTDTWTLVVAGLVVALLRATTPILFAALGALVSDLAGCVNVALEGLMLVAAFFGVMGAVQAADLWPALPVWAHALIGGGAALLAALVLALLLAVFHLEFGADLIVAGIAMNLLAAGLTVFLMASWVGDKGSTATLVSPALPALRVPGLGVGSVDRLIAARRLRRVRAEDLRHMKLPLRRVLPFVIVDGHRPGAAPPAPTRASGAADAGTGTGVVGGVVAGAPTQLGLFG